MQIDLSDHWFVIIFHQELIVGMLAKDRDRSFHINGELFTAVDDNYLTAFVDRLLDAHGQIVGINVSPTSDSTERLLRDVQSARYTTLGPTGLQIWFSESPIENAINSAEQAFGGQVFASASGELALSVDAASLFSAADVERLRQGCATWVTLGS